MTAQHGCTVNRNALYFRLETKKPSHHGEKASLFTGKFERAIDLSSNRQAMINQFMEERMDAVAFAYLDCIITDLYNSVKRKMQISEKISIVDKFTPV